MGLFVKICGLARARDVEAVAALGPDAMGFVFWPGSKRAVCAEEVAVWTRGLPAGIAKVGVFVDEAQEAVQRVRETAGLDVVQLHGGEDASYCTALAGRLWKAVHLEGGGTGSADNIYPVEALLVDSHTADAPGGTGVVADWEAARAFIAGSAIPVLLAGGLRPDNVREAVRRAKPWGVDASSGLEQRPGEKDVPKVKDFIQRCRS